MKLIARLACCLAVIAGLFFVSERDAKALGPVDVEAGLKVGVATNPIDVGNPFGFGLGVRGGVGIYNLWLGVGLMHYFGGNDYSSNLVGGEVGYTIKSIPLLQIRPQLGFGDAIFRASGTFDGITVSDSQGYFYLEPGITVLVPLGLLYVGADANILVLPSVPGGATGSDKLDASFTIHGQIGVRL